MKLPARYEGSRKRLDKGRNKAKETDREEGVQLEVVRGVRRVGWERGWKEEIRAGFHRAGEIPC